jgi:hypothetical protein
VLLLLLSSLAMSALTSLAVLSAKNAKLLPKRLPPLLP